MRVIASAEIDQALAFPALIDALSDAFRGDMVTPVRHHHDIERAGSHGTLLLMPAWTGPAARDGLQDGLQDGFLGVKVVSVFPNNGAKGLPSVMGSYLLMDGGTGEPVAVLDGTRLTVWRTAAASALAARHLARPDASRMVMVGSGALAPFLIRAHLSQRPIREVCLWNHRPEKAHALAAALRRDGWPVTAVTDLEAAVREADLISCATLSTAPIVKGAWLKDGAHLDLVGAFNLNMREADDEALRRAEVYVDTDAAKSEGGDVAVSIRTGAIPEGHVRGTLFDLCRNPPQWNERAVTVFKSVGTALEDLAAAMLVWRSLANPS
ncbi:ornithine cyclodeaminase family protein [Microvirga pakistanensis]|uniref:ornithine cyclodeaminase family protein n=1 Tax=Microvirga pakistanensis TaxID=1682650 RepID=UPI0010695006|nr:ornithine cyclodeaminase family protein [Microvirga pakistanensis]